MKRLKIIERKFRNAYSDCWDFIVFEVARNEWLIWKADEELEIVK